MKLVHRLQGKGLLTARFFGKVEDRKDAKQFATVSHGPPCLAASRKGSLTQKGLQQFRRLFVLGDIALAYPSRCSRFEFVKKDALARAEFKIFAQVITDEAFIIVKHRDAF